LKRFGSTNKKIFWSKHFRRIPICWIKTKRVILWKLTCQLSPRNLTRTHENRRVMRSGCEVRKNDWIVSFYCWVGEGTAHSFRGFVLELKDDPKRVREEGLVRDAPLGRGGGLVSSPPPNLLRPKWPSPTSLGLRARVGWVAGRARHSRRWGVGGSAGQAAGWTTPATSWGMGALWGKRRSDAE